MEQILHTSALMLEGSKVTLKIFFLTLMMALPLGLIVALIRLSGLGILRWAMEFYIWIMRGTPLMLQLLFVYFALPMVGVRLNDLSSALLAFTMNYAAYFAEIYRGGIESISKGQYEAGQVLGMTKTQTFFRVVLLQVVKRILPPMSNEIITLVKDTSLARIIAVSEILMCAERFTGKGLIWPLFYTAVFFLIFNGVLTLLFGYLEKKLNYFRS